MHFDSAPDGKMNHNILCFFGDDGWLLYGYIVLLFDRLRDVDHFSVVNILELNQHHQTSQFQSAAQVEKVFETKGKRLGLNRQKDTLRMWCSYLFVRVITV